MNRKYIVLISAIFLFLVLVGLVVFYDSPQKTVPITPEVKKASLYEVFRNVGGSQTCVIEGEYCVYNLPDFLKYPLPNQSLPADKEIPYSDSTKYLIRNSTSKTKEYVCITGEKVIDIDYFDLVCPNDGRQGCGYSRSALICKDYYFISEFSSSYGPRLYGPFEYSN